MGDEFGVSLMRFIIWRPQVIARRFRAPRVRCLGRRSSAVERGGANRQLVMRFITG